MVHVRRMLRRHCYQAAGSHISMLTERRFKSDVSTLLSTRTTICSSTCEQLLEILQNEVGYRNHIVMHLPTCYRILLPIGGREARRLEIECPIKQSVQGFVGRGASFDMPCKSVAVCIRNSPRFKWLHHRWNQFPVDHSRSASCSVASS